jgi:5-methylcytosine-specific restriction endonuclease McrA
MQGSEQTSSSSVLKCKTCKSWFGSTVEFQKHREAMHSKPNRVETKKKEFTKKPSSRKASLVISELKKRVVDLEREVRDLKALLKGNEKKPTFQASDPFYLSPHWRRLRYQAFATYPKECMACGAQRAVLHVDHIKPRSKYPELELSFDNLQILCADCNYGKSNLDETDWRPHALWRNRARQDIGF